MILGSIAIDSSTYVETPDLLSLWNLFLHQFSVERSSIKYRTSLRLLIHNESTIR